MYKQLFVFFFIAISAFAAPTPGKLTFDSVTMGSLTAKTQTLSNISGYLEDVTISVSDGVSTGSVWLALIPENGSAVNIATNVIVGSKLFRPVVDSTDILGAALSSDPPRRMYLLGETLRIIVGNSPTNKVWNIKIKTVN